MASACSEGDIEQTPFVYSEDKHSIIGDVFFDKKLRAVPYAIYVANGSSVLELFLCDFLMCGVFFKEAYYLNALRVLNVGENSDQYVVEEKIKDVVFHKVFHRFKEIEELFRGIFDFDFPDWSELNKRIFRRHNIVHRYALSNIDRMTVCDATTHDVKDLINTIVVFVEEMKKKMLELNGSGAYDAERPCQAS